MPKRLLDVIFISAIATSRLYYDSMPNGDFYVILSIATPIITIAFLYYFGYDPFYPFDWGKFNLGSLGFGNIQSALNTTGFLIFAYESHIGIRKAKNVNDFLKNGGFNLWPYIAVMLTEQITNYCDDSNIFAYFMFLPALYICCELRYREMRDDRDQCGKTNIKIVKEDGKSDSIAQLFIGNTLAIACKLTMSYWDYKNMVGLELLCAIAGMESYRSFYS